MFEISGQKRQPVMLRCGGDGDIGKTRVATDRDGRVGHLAREPGNGWIKGKDAFAKSFDQAAEPKIQPLCALSTPAAA